MITVDQGVQQYYPLGPKTLFMLILRKSGIPFLFFIGIIVGVFFLDSVPENLFNTAVTALLVSLVVFIFLFIIAFFIGWLEYYRFSIAISNKDVRIKRGFIATEEIGVPFRRIRDVKIKRSLMDQIFGVSDIVVILSDFEGNSPMSDESTMFLPSIEKGIAMEIQNSILRKSQVEQINLINTPEANQTPPSSIKSGGVNQ